MKKPDPLFLIITGAITALGLPFALAFPRSLVEKLAAMLVLVAIAAGVAALVVRKKR